MKISNRKTLSFIGKVVFYMRVYEMAKNLVLRKKIS